MQPKFIVDAPQSKYIEEAKPPGPPLISKSRKKIANSEDFENSILMPDLTDILEDQFEYQNIFFRTYSRYKKRINFMILLFLGALAYLGLSDDFFIF